MVVQKTLDYLCHRCKIKVYPVDKVGPLKNVYFHQACFRCFVCSISLNMRTFIHNQHDSHDKEVYCSVHVPKISAAQLDSQAFSIKSALEAPHKGKSFNEQIRGDSRYSMNTQSMEIQEAIRSAKQLNHVPYHNPSFDHNLSKNGHSNSQSHQRNGFVHHDKLSFSEEYLSQRDDSDISLSDERNFDHLQNRFNKKSFSNSTLLEKVRLMRNGNDPAASHKLNDGDNSHSRFSFEDASKNKLHEVKAALDKSSDFKRVFRPSEDKPDLLNETYTTMIPDVRQTNFKNNANVILNKANSSIDPQLNQSLNQDFSRYEPKPKQRMPLSQETRGSEDTLKNVDVVEQMKLEKLLREEEDEMYMKFAKKRSELEAEFENKYQDELRMAIKSITDKYKGQLERSKAWLSSSKDARAHESVLLSDDSAENLLQHPDMKVVKLQRDTIEKDLTLRRRMEKDALTELMKENERSAAQALIDKHSQAMLDHIIHKQSRTDVKSHFMNEVPPPTLSEPPKLKPPKKLKTEIYDDPSVFEDIDEQAINIANEDFNTFTEIVHQLTANCYTDVQKARGIFRWITVKNLSQMDFDSDIKSNTPLGLLRGIKYGTENYHMLFKRLCSYAGLHCVVIRGYSKSVGYLPGMKFEDKKFQNTWNAVYVDNEWRFVQCNWGARHLVSSKDKSSNSPDSNNSKKYSVQNLRYEYDDHYFLTDPDQFCYEFFPKQPECQLLEKPISIEEFEEKPFVRNLFFKYGLQFSDPQISSTLLADASGACKVSIVIPTEHVSSLIFHYNLRVFESDVDEYDGVKMRRYAIQTLLGNTVVIKVHCPFRGNFILDVFAYKVKNGDDYMNGTPMKFKSVCKLKITCSNLIKIMIPLPDCSSGEWGPIKAYKLFGLVPLTHEDAVINTTQSQIEVSFKLMYFLSDFMTRLHKNDTSEHILSECVVAKWTERKSVINFYISLPSEGQYGLDIFIKDVPSNAGEEQEESPTSLLMSHCCKYLINYRKKSNV